VCVSKLGCTFKNVIDVTISFQEKLPAKNPCMEIERKFVVPEDFKERLEEHGFGLVKEFEEVLQDKYYDTNEHHLLHKVKTFGYYKPHLKDVKTFCFSL